MQHAFKIERRDEAFLGGPAFLPEILIDSKGVGEVEKLLIVVVSDASG